MALNRNNTFNPNDTSWMDAGADPSERGFVSKSLRFIFGTAKGIVTGTVQGAWNELAGDHLDKLDDAKEVFDDFTSAAEKATSDLGKELKGLKSATKEVGLKYTEGMAEAMPSGLYRRLSRAFEEEEEDTGPSAADQFESSLSSNLASIFSAQARHTAGLHRVSMQSAATDRALAAKYHAQDIRVAVAGTQAATNIDNFLHSTYVNYLKKDLELKYRNLHLMRSLSSNVESLKGEFKEDGVIGKLLANTNPLGQTVREHELYTRTTTSSYKKNFFSETLDNLIAIPTAAIQAVSGVLSMHAAVPFSGVSDVVSSVVRHTSPWLLKKIGKRVLSEESQRKWGKRWERVQQGFDILNGDFGALAKLSSMKLNSLARKMQNSDNWLMQMIGNMMPVFERNTEIQNKAATNPTDPAVFDNLTRETIVTIIPEHLSRIGDYFEAFAKSQGIQINHDDSKVWDVRTRSFVTRADQRRRNLDMLYGTQRERKERYNANVDTFIDLTGTGTDFAGISMESSIGKSSEVREAQHNMVQRYQQDLSSFIEASAYYNLSLDVKALISCANNDEDLINHEEYLKKVFGKIDDRARNTARTILSLVSRFDKTNKIRGIDHVLVRHINKRIADRAKEHDVEGDVRQQLLNMNMIDHEFYKFNLYGNGSVRVNQHLDQYKDDFLASGGVDIGKRYDEKFGLEGEDDTAQKLDKSSRMYRAFSRMLSKNERERLLKDQLALNTGMSSAALIPGFLLRWAQSGYNFAADKFGWAQNELNQFLGKSELYQSIMTDAKSKMWNTIIRIKPVRRDPKDKNIMLFDIVVKMTKTGNGDSRTFHYGTKLTKADWENFRVEEQGKANHALSSFVDDIIEKLGKKDFNVNYSYNLLDTWPSGDEETTSADTYDYVDIIYNDPTKSNKSNRGTITSGINQYLESIDRNLADIRNDLVTGPKRLSVYDQKRRFAKFVKQRAAAVAKRISSMKKEPEEQKQNGTVLPDAVLYDPNRIQNSADEEKTLEAEKECQDIFDAAISKFFDETKIYCKYHLPPDKYPEPAMYGIALSAKNHMNPPVFGYEDPYKWMKNENKYVKDPYKPMNDWLQKNGSVLRIGLNPWDGSFAEGIREIERIVFGKAEAEAQKEIDDEYGSSNKQDTYEPTIKPRQAWEVYSDRARNIKKFKIKDSIFNLTDLFQHDRNIRSVFQRILIQYKNDVLKHTAYTYWYAAFESGSIMLNHLYAGIMKNLSKNPGFLKVLKPFMDYIPTEYKTKEEFASRMSHWIKSNYTNIDINTFKVKETPVITVANLDIGAGLVEKIVHDWAHAEVHDIIKKYKNERLIGPQKPNKSSNDTTWNPFEEESKSFKLSNSLTSNTFKDYLFKGYAPTKQSVFGKLAERLGFKKATPQFNVSDASFGLTGNTNSGNIINSAAQKIATNRFIGTTGDTPDSKWFNNPNANGWFANSETYNINNSSKGLSIKPEVNAGTVIPGKGSVLSSGYADGTFGRATLHTDNSLKEKVKKSRMFSALTRWVKAITNKDKEANIPAEVKKVMKEFEPKDLIAPATIAVLADKMDVSNALSASQSGGGTSIIPGIPTSWLQKIGHGLWAGTKGVGKGLWTGTKWLGKGLGKGARALFKTPKIAGPLLAGLAGATMGFMGSRSSNASWTSTAVSTTAGFGAASMMYANIWNPVGWALAGILAINSAREGWTDEAHLKKTFNAMHTATASQKGASALGNILNVLSFGYLKRSGKQAAIDRAIYNSGAGQGAGGIGEVVAGIADAISPDNVGETSALKDVDLLRARAKLQVDVDRGYDGAQQRLDAFNAAIKAKDWPLAREIAAFHGITEQEAQEKAKARIKNGFRLIGGKGEDPQEVPMSQDEVASGYNALNYAVSRDKEYQYRLYDYKECILGERWAQARNIVREVLADLKRRNDVRAGIYFSEFTAYTTPGARESDDTDSNTRAKLYELRKQYERMQKRGKKVDPILEEIDRALNGQYVVHGEYGTVDMRDADEHDRKRALNAYSARPIPASDQIKFVRLMEQRSANGDQAAFLSLRQFKRACEDGNWFEAYDIMESFGGIGGSTTGLSKPMTASEVQMARSKLVTAISKTNNPFTKHRLNEFDTAVANGNWGLARKIAGETGFTIIAGDYYEKKLSDNKMTDPGPMAQKWRFIYNKVQRALARPQTEDTKAALTRLRNDMKAKELIDIDQTWLNKCANELAQYDKTVNNLNDRAAIATFENNRLNKKDLYERQEDLLKEIEKSIARSPNQYKAELYEKVANIPMDFERDSIDRLLNQYDRRLRSLDEYAVSTKRYSQAESKRINDLEERRNNLLGQIAVARSEAEDAATIEKLDTLTRKVKKPFIDDITSEQLDKWDEELSSIDPAAYSSVKMSTAQLLHIDKMRAEKIKLMNKLKGALKRSGTKYEAASKLQALLDKITPVRPDNMTDAMVQEWNAEFDAVYDVNLTGQAYENYNGRDNNAANEAREGLIEAAEEYTFMLTEIGRGGQAKALSAHIENFSRIDRDKITMDDVKKFQEIFNQFKQIKNDDELEAFIRKYPSSAPIDQQERAANLRRQNPTMSVPGQSTSSTSQKKAFIDITTDNTDLAYSQFVGAVLSNTVLGIELLDPKYGPYFNGKPIESLSPAERVNIPLEQQWNGSIGWRLFQQDIVKTEMYKQVTMSGSFSKHISDPMGRIKQAALSYIKNAKFELPWAHRTAVDKYPDAWWLAIREMAKTNTAPILDKNNGFRIPSLNSGAVEQAVSLDRNGNIVDQQSGSATSVSLKTAPGGQIIHTHPDGSPTSATDIATAIQNKQTSVTTLRSEGNILGYSGQKTRNITGETISVKRDSKTGEIELNKALTDMTKGMQNGFNSIDTNRDVLVGIYDRLGDVINAVSEHNVEVNDRIDYAALKSYDLAKKFTERMTRKVKDVASVFNRPSVINISK